MKASEILDRLEKRHAGDIFVRELRGSAGFGPMAERYIDAWAMETAPSRGNRRTSYEIKVSRSDFLRDIKQPFKHRPALVFSNEFYFVAPKGLLKPEEIPLFAGLLEVLKEPDEKIRWHQRGQIVESLSAPWRDTVPPSWRFVVSLCRSVAKASSVSGHDEKNGNAV